MSIETDKNALKSDIQSLYNALNSIITVGAKDEIDPITFKAEDIDDEDIQKIVSVIRTMKSDEYLGANSTLYQSFNTAENQGVYNGNLWYSVKEGKLISPNAINPLKITLQSFEDIKCRNQAINKHETQSNQYNKLGQDTYGRNSNTKNGHGGDSRKHFSNKALGDCNNDVNTIAHSNTKQSNGVNENTTTVDIFCKNKYLPVE